MTHENLFYDLFMHDHVLFTNPLKSCYDESTTTLPIVTISGWIKDFWKGVSYVQTCEGFAVFISFLKYPIGYLKRGWGRGGIWICH